MQVIRALALLVFCALTATAVAQVQQARGKATVSYQGKSATADVKARALQAAQLKAVDFYYAEAGESESANLDAIRGKIIADPDRFFLETTQLAEEDRPDTQQYTVTVRVALNVANLRNAVKADSVVGRSGRTERSPLAFVFVSRQVDSTKSYDDRVYKRIDESVAGKSSDQISEKGVDGESVGRGQVRTETSSSVQASSTANLTRTRETGGSTVKKASESTWRIMPSSNLSQVFTAVFARAGYKVNEAALIEPYTGGHFKVATLEDDYRSGLDLKPATMSSIVLGMRAAQIPFIAFGTLDVGAAGKDPSTGLVRVGVTVNAKLLDVSQTIPDTIASVGPVQYAGLGPTEDEARNSAMKLAAESASRDLTSQSTNLGLR